MKKILEVIKKILIWLGAVFTAIFAVLFVRECSSNDSGHDHYGEEDKEDVDEINRRAAKKREEAINRISNTDARTLCESYGSVCDTIADGKERFRRRCRRTDN